MEQNFTETLSNNNNNNNNLQQSNSQSPSPQQQKTDDAQITVDTSPTKVNIPSASCSLKTAETNNKTLMKLNNPDAKTPTANVTSYPSNHDVASLKTKAPTNIVAVAPQIQQQQVNQPHNNNISNNNYTTEQKRPMNAFLLFCKKHRSLVKEKNPHLENRGITKILGEWWSDMNKEQKSSYQELAKQHKEAFMKANPDFKWYKTDLKPPVVSTNNSYSTNHVSYESNKHVLEAPKPPKKRYLENGHHQGPLKLEHSSSTKSIEIIAHHAKDRVVPFHLDQDTLEKVIDHCYLETSDGNSSGTSESNQIPIPPSTKCYTAASIPISVAPIAVTGATAAAPSCSLANDIPLYPFMNLISTANANSVMTSAQSNFSYTPTTTTLTTMTKSKLDSSDEPVDFSMNRTITTNRQQIINNLVEKMLSEPDDHHNALSKPATKAVLKQSPLAPIAASATYEPNSVASTTIAPMITSLATSDYTTTASATTTVDTNSLALSVISPAALPSGELVNGSSTKNHLNNFDLEKKLTELPLFEMNSPKLENNVEQKLEGLASLAEAASLRQNFEQNT